jgi:hypothetical protein
MKGHILAAAALAAASLAMSAPQAKAQVEFTATFSGFQETGALNAETGSILSNGTAKLTLLVNKFAQTATFTLTFSGLSTPITQSHIHFGRVHTPGNVIVFFCSNLNNGPAGTQLCPQNATSGTVTGTITAADIIAVPSQGVPADNFDALTDALNSNTAYGNIHTTQFPAGEIRGQVLIGELGDFEN